MGSTFEKKLARAIKGDVSVSFRERTAFSYDESIYALTPRCVVAPKTETDIQTIVAYALDHGIALTSRGGGSGVAGQAIGSGIILDTKRYLHSVKELREQDVVVEPGISLAALQSYLQPYGKRIAPNPGSSAWCTLGGMVSTNASGPHSLKWGCTREHVESLRVVMADASIVDTRIGSSTLAELKRFFTSQRSYIEKHWPQTMKNSSGYHLPAFFNAFNPYAGIFAGAEGTLGVISEVAIKIVPLPKFTSLAMFAFASIAEAIDALDDLLLLEPSALELMDPFVIKALQRANYGFVETLGLANAGAALWVEWEDDLPNLSGLNPTIIIRDEKERLHAWSLRSKVSKILHQMAGDRKPLRCIEDACVPLAALQTYVREVQQILKKHDAVGPIFGHIGEGNLHINPWIDVRKPKFARRLKLLMNEFYHLVLRHGGTISGEHGDGYLRGEYAQKQWKNLWPYFEKVKYTLDPLGIMNPGKKIPAKLDLQIPFKNLTNTWEGATDARPVIQKTRPKLAETALLDLSEFRKKAQLVR